METVELMTRAARRSSTAGKTKWRATLVVAFPCKSAYTECRDPSLAGCNSEADVYVENKKLPVRNEPQERQHSEVVRQSWRRVRVLLCRCSLGFFADLEFGCLAKK